MPVVAANAVAAERSAIDAEICDATEAVGAMRGTGPAPVIEGAMTGVRKLMGLVLSNS